MTTDDIVCLRYLDDFIILGPDEKSVKRMFAKEKKILGGLNLEVYEVTDQSGKSSFGMVNNKFEFLGVEIDKNNIRPSKSSRKRLTDSIKEITRDSLKESFYKQECKKQSEHSLSHVLKKSNNKIKGWGNQYSFCNDKSIWGSLDEDLSEIMGEYLLESKSIYTKLGKKEKRRLLGIHLISESNSVPISIASTK